MIRVRKELGVIADVVLEYRPPEKAKATNGATNGGPNVLKRNGNYTHVYNSPFQRLTLVKTLP